ncbi:unnamed protein product [Scytosiphon promiscuus]
MIKPPATETARASEQPGENSQLAADTERPSGSRDDEEEQFLSALKGLVDGAVKLLGADMGVGTWLITGLLRKGGLVDSFVESMVVFANRRISALVDASSPRGAASILARRLRQHAQAHDATTAALGIRAGRKRTGSRTSTNLGNESHDGDASTSYEDEELKEEDVQVVRLWRQWKRSGGFWPTQMPDPDDDLFGGPDGTNKFLDKLDEGTHSFLRDVSRDVLDTALPEDAEELQAACEAAAGSGSSQGAGGDSSRSIVETANRLAQLKSGVLEPMLCQALMQQVVGRFCRSAKLWQFVLRLVRPGTNLSPAGRDMEHPQAFSLVAGALERSDKTPSGTLRMELMQGLVKMAWSARGGADVSGSGEATNPSGGSGTLPASSDSVGASRTANPSLGDSRTPGRSGSVDSAGWSEVDLDVEKGDPKDEHRSRGNAPPVAGATSDKSEGARDIFNMPYSEQLSDGLVGGEKDKFYEDLEDHALDEIAKWMKETVDEIPLGNACLPESWIPDRVNAARALARRPTNLMLVLSLVDAAKSMVEAAGDKDKRRASDTASHNLKSAVLQPHSGASEAGFNDAAPKMSEAHEKIANPSGAEQPQGAGGNGGGIRRRRKRAGGKRDTPGWRAWEARRELFFGMDIGVAALHLARSLLGQETVELFDGILKAVTLEYRSVEATVRGEASRNLGKCSDKAAPNLLHKVKPRSTGPILYVSSQIRMLRALKKAGLDFSKSLGEGPQKKALSRRFKSYSWIFTDSLIDKLVTLRIEDVARSRAMEGESASLGLPVSEHDGNQSSEEGEVVRKSKEGADRADRVTKWRELKQERRVCRSDIMREMTAGSSSSKDLLLKVIGSWLPAVLAADRAAEI